MVMGNCLVISDILRISLPEARSYELILPVLESAQRASAMTQRNRRITVGSRFLLWAPQIRVLDKEPTAQVQRSISSFIYRLWWWWVNRVYIDKFIVKMSFDYGDISNLSSFEARSSNSMKISTSNSTGSSSSGSLTALSLLISNS